MRSERRRRSERRWLAAAPTFALALIIAGAVVLRLPTLASQSLWYDESSTALLMHVGFGRMLGLLPQTQSEPPVYFVLTWIWARIFGDGAVALRSFSLVVGCAMVPAAYFAARGLARRQVALIAAALTATSPLLVWYSQEARAYILFAALGMVSFGCFVRVLHRPREQAAPWLIAWALTAALSLACHYFAVFAIAPQIVWLLVRQRSRRTLAAAALPVLTGAALLPLAISQRGTGATSWIAGLPLRLRVEQVPQQLLVGFSPTIGSALAWLGLALALGAIVLVVARGDQGERQLALAGAIVGVAAVLIPLVLVAGGLDYLITRNVMLAWGPLALLLAAGLGARRAAWLGPLVALALTGLGVGLVIHAAADPRLQRPDWRSVASVLRGQAGAKTGSAQIAAQRVVGAPLAANAQRVASPPLIVSAPRAVVLRRYSLALPLALYVPRLWWMPAQGALVHEIDVVSSPWRGRRACWWGAACNIVPAPAPRGAPVAGFVRVGVLRLGEFVITRFGTSGLRRVTPDQLAGAPAGANHNAVLLMPERSPITGD